MAVYLTRHDNGAGLGDAIVQNNWLHRLAHALGCRFHYRPTRSPRHLKSSGRESYDELLGLSQYRNPDLGDGFQTVELGRFSLDALRELVALDGAGSPDKLVIVRYPYDQAPAVSLQLDLLAHPAFPWADHIETVPCSVPAVDVVIHLRFGDSLAYPVLGREGWVFDARRRRVVEAVTLPPDKLWTLERVAEVLAGVRQRQRSAVLLSDGPDTAFQMLSAPAAIETAGVPVDVLKASVAHAWERALRLASQSGQALVTGELRRDIDLIRQARQIVWTEGVFARKVNEYLRRDPAPMAHLHAYAWEEAVYPPPPGHLR